MNRIALKMLLGDRAKYLGLVFGVAFATLLITQQMSVFIGLMARMGSDIYNIPQAQVWVMDKRVRYIEDIEPLRDVELQNVRSVEGVDWAVPLYRGYATIRMPDGLNQQVQLMGVDDASLMGLCSNMVVGTREGIRRPQHGIMDLNGFYFAWPKEKPRAGKVVEINDSRVVVGGICDPLPTFFSFPMLYVSYDTAMEISPAVRNRLSFVLVRGKDGIDPQTLADQIERKTGLLAMTGEQFAQKSISYIIEQTGIAINFGITVFLGVLVGGAITAQTFYIFVIENLRQFAAMKAIGVTNHQLFRMVLTQASLVTVIGFSFGLGLTTLFFLVTSDIPALKGFTVYWQVVVGTFVTVCLISLLSILFSLRRVFKLDPAIVFRG